MEIELKGGTRKQKELARRVLAVTCYSLLSNKLFHQIHCDVHIHKPPDLFGSCTWEDINIRPRDFTIEVHKEMDEKNFIMTICHEAVHLKQYTRGELRELYRGGHRLMWYDKDCTNIPYNKLPWEIEASALERGLYNNYIEFNLHKN